MCAVALIGHEVIGLSWPEAFVLGAIVSPTDAVAPAEILRRVGAPRRLVAVIEGENLTNDWTALVLYSFAVAAVVTETFSLGEAALEFVWSGVGGLAIGLIAGRIIREVRRPSTTPRPGSRSRCCPATRLPARRGARRVGRDRGRDRGHLHGLAHARADHAADADPGRGALEILTFLLNAVLFLLVGFQLPNVIDAISGHTTGELILWGVLVSAVVIVVRLAWQFTVVYLIRAVDRRAVQRERSPLGSSAWWSAGPGCAGRSRSPRRWRFRSIPTRARRSPSAT